MRERSFIGVVIIVLFAADVADPIDSELAVHEREPHQGGVSIKDKLDPHTAVRLRLIDNNLNRLVHVRDGLGDFSGSSVRI